MFAIALCGVLVLWLSGKVRTPTGRSLLDQWANQLSTVSVSRVLAIAATLVIIALVALAGTGELPLLLTIDLTGLLDILFAVWLAASSRRIGAVGACVQKSLRQAVEVSVRPLARRTDRAKDRSPPSEAALPPANDDAEEDPAEHLEAA
ncbi:MAG: hypothetical protein Q8L23_18035 [Caulobacter sp.]|nr:hypothetical protein [Caulobacter sp.]